LDPDALAEQVRNFPLDVLENPWDMSFETLSYGVLLGADAIDLSRERVYVRALGRRRNDWSDLADRLDSVLENRWQFERRPGPWKLSRGARRSRAHIADLDSSFRDCVAELPDNCDDAAFPPEPTSVNVPRRMLLDRLWVNGGFEIWCRAATSTRPRSGCDSQQIGFLVGPSFWAKTQLYEAPQADGRLTLWTEPKGPAVGWTMRWSRGGALYACDNGRVTGKKGALCGSVPAKENVGYAFNPRVP